MSTDTAFALGMLALVGPRFSDRLRAFMLTVVVVDDLLALVVIATVYASSVVTWALLVAIGFFGLVLLANRLPARLGLRVVRARRGRLGVAAEVGHRPGRRSAWRWVS